MLQNGIVKKRNINTAEVEIQRGSACGESCASCGLCPGQTTVVKAVNDTNAAEGDTVILDLANKKVLGAAFLVYIVPLILLFIGYFIGYAIFKSELGGIGIGFGMMAVAFLVIILLDRRLKAKYTPRIVRVEGKSNE